MIQLLQYEFMQRALIAALLTGLMAPAIGTYIVQRRLSLLGDGLGHVAIAGVGLAVMTGTAPTPVAVVVAVVGAVERGQSGEAEQDVVGHCGIGRSPPGVQPGGVVDDPQPGLEGDPSCPVFLDDGRHPLVLQTQHLGDVHGRGPSAWVCGKITNRTLFLS